MAHARGKVILLGEHAVVYGRPALVVGIENGAEASASLADSSSVSVGVHCARAGEGDLGRAFEVLLRSLDMPPTKAHVDLGIPAGCGLGASAAAGVAIARAALDLLEPTQGESEQRRVRILRAAHAWETVFHGTPSGIDAAAATLGGCFVYSKAHPPEAIRLHKPMTLAVAVADRPANTKTMVELVAQRLTQFPERTHEIFARVEHLVTLAKEALAAGAIAAMGPLMNENHALLTELGVSTQALDQACNIARASGALGAKLTGSGGGGCVVALCAGNAHAVLDAWGMLGLSGFETVLGSVL